MTKYALKSNYDSKIGNLELKIPDLSGLLQRSSFNSKVTELENKIKTAESKPDTTNLTTKSSLNAVENEIPDVNGFVKKTDYATEITNIKDDYVTNGAFTSQLNDLKSQHIADEVKKVNDKVVKNTSNILNYKISLDHNKSVINDLEREASFSRVFYYYNQQSYLLLEGKVSSYVKTSNNISGWKSTGIYSNYYNDNYPHLKFVNNANGAPKLLIENGRFCVNFKANYMKQDKISYLHGSVVNIYIVYSLKNRNINNPDFTVKNGLFGAVKITKYVNTSNYKYSGNFLLRHEFQYSCK